MATITRYCNPDSTAGGDGTTNATTGANRAYASLSALEAAQQQNFDTGNNIGEWICETGGTADTTAATIDGSVTSATDYIDIKTSASHRHAGVWNAAKWRLELTVSSPCITVSDNYVKCTGLQLSVGHTNSLAGGIVAGTAGNAPWLVDSCIVRSTVAAQAPGITYSGVTAAAHTQAYVNNIVYGFTGVGAYGIYVRGNGASARATVSNNTVYNCTTGLRSRDANVVWKNNLVIGCTDCYLETTAAEVADYNAYDDSAAVGTNSINLSSSTDAQIFTDATTADFRLFSTSTAKDVGTDLSADTYYAFSTDITGAARSGTWDVGAHEYVAAGGANPKGPLSNPLAGPFGGPI